MEVHEPWMFWFTLVGAAFLVYRIYKGAEEDSDFREWCGKMIEVGREAVFGVFKGFVLLTQLAVPLVAIYFVSYLVGWVLWFFPRLRG